MTSSFRSSPGYLKLMDGPGEGKRFYVQRAPMFIRAVSTPNDGWDILDLLDDEPEPHEEVHVYRQLSWMHVRANRRRDSGLYYDYCHVPVDGTLKAILRSTRRWQEWAIAQGAELSRQAS